MMSAGSHGGLIGVGSFEERGDIHDVGRSPGFALGRQLLYIGNETADAPTWVSNQVPCARSGADGAERTRRAGERASGRRLPRPSAATD